MTSRQRLPWMVLALVAAARADIEAETKALEARLKAFAKGPERGARGLFADTVTASIRPDPLARPRSERRGGFHVHHWTGGAPEQYARARLGKEFPRGAKLKVLRSERREGRLHARLRMTFRRPRRAVKAAFDAVLTDDRISRFVLVEWRDQRADAVPFEDMTAGAGMEATDPAVLDHPTLGLAAYGAKAADVDNDGRIDVLSTGHDTNRLYLNRGDETFRMVEVKSPRQATAPLFLDYDNDGDADLFLSANGKQMLLENRLVPDGELLFVDVSEAKGIAVPSIGFSSVAGDVNGDGRPDVYVAAYNNYGPVAPENWDDARNGLPNLLFVSQPDGTFREEAAKRGVADARWSYAAHFVDIDGDGRLDLYVANDFGAGNAMFMNRGDRFVDEAKERGIRDDGYAMGVAFGDVDNDGRVDLHVTRMSSKAGNRILARGGVPDAPRLKHLALGNGLYRQVAPGRFEDVTRKAGPFPAGWAWGGGFLDIDNDGFEDLYVPNGHMSNESAVDT